MAKDWSEDKVKEVNAAVLSWVNSKRIHKFDADHPRYARMPGIKEKLKRLVLRNGYIFLLPFDQILETATGEFLEYPHSLHACFHLAIAKAMGLSGVVLHPGIAESYRKGELGDVPLVLKINAATRIPSKYKDESSPFGEIDDMIDKAVELNAVAIAWTFFFGSAKHYGNQQLMGHVINRAHRRGFPVIVWAYPRGENVEAHGGADALCNVADAIAHSVAAGADVVKAGYPEPNTGEVKEKALGRYRCFELDSQQCLRWIVNGPLASTGIIVSGGPKLAGRTFTLEEKTESIVEAGCDGLCYGRNIFENDARGAVETVRSAMAILDKHTRTGRKVSDSYNIGRATEFVSQYAG